MPCWQDLPTRGYVVRVVGRGVSLRERRRQQTSLEISDVAVGLFAERGFAGTTVAEVADAAGVSVRTFHRLFPTKESVVAPVLEAGWTVFVDAFATRPDHEPVLKGLVAALARSVEGDTARRHLRFLRTLPGEPTLEPEWLRVLDRCTVALQPVLASRLGLVPDSPQAAFTAGCVVAANRVAVQAWVTGSGRSIVDVARACLVSIDAALLQPQPRLGPRSGPDEEGVPR